MTQEIEYIFLPTFEPLEQEYRVLHAGGAAAAAASAASSASGAAAAGEMLDTHVHNIMPGSAN
jgi:hypothetical protein